MCLYVSGQEPRWRWRVLANCGTAMRALVAWKIFLLSTLEGMVPERAPSRDTHT